MKQPWLIAVALMAGVGVASAQSKPAAKPVPKPVPKAVCAPAYSETSRIVFAGGVAVACWREAADKPESCISVGATSQPAVASVPPVAAPVTLGAEVKDEGGKLSACMGTTCKKLGKKLAAAIAKEKAKKAKEGADYYGDPTPHATTDLKAVVFAGKAWSVAGDKPLKLKAPKEYKKEGGDKPSLGTVDIAGKWLVSNWGNCAGPCGEAVVASTAGANVGAWFPSGDILALDAKRYVVVPADAAATLTVLDAATAKQTGTLALSEGVLEGLTGAKVDDQTLVALWNDGSSAWKVGWVSIPDGKAPTLTATKSIPQCPN